MCCPLTGAPVGPSGSTVTQTRPFLYNSDQRLQSVTNPEIAGVKNGYGSQAQALMMMHEAVHLAGLGDAAFGGSKQLTGILLDNCFPVLKPYLGGLTQ